MDRLTIGVLVEDGIAYVSSSSEAVDLIVAYEDHDLNDSDAQATRERERAIALIEALPYVL